MKKNILLVFIIFCSPILAWAQKNMTSSPSNIALGKTCRCEPMPDLPYIGQLTDGKLASTPPLWVGTEGTVWKEKTPVIVTVDLGSIQPISGVSIHMGAGAGDVVWPRAIDILVADEAGKYYFVDDLVRLSRKQHGPEPSIKMGREGYQVHNFQTHNLKTHGRYVNFVFWLGVLYFAMDEIEIYAGDQDWVTLPLQGTPVSDLKSYTASMMIRKPICLRMQSDIETLRAKAAQSNVPESLRKEVLTELNSIEKRIDGDVGRSYGKNYRAVLPLDPLHQEIFNVQAKLWQSRGLAPLTVWTSDLWGKLTPFDDPSAGNPAEVRVDMMLNEYRAGALNLTNTTQRPMTVDLAFEGLPGGSAPDYIQVHEVAWTDNWRCGPIAAALPEANRQGNVYRIQVLPGLTRQLWLTFHPTRVTAGFYQGKIRIKSGSQNLNVPLNINLYPICFPDQPALHLAGFDESNMDPSSTFTRENRDLIMSHLRSHYVDCLWSSPDALTPGKYTDDGIMVTKPDTANFDRWYKRYPWARQYRIHLAVNNKFEQFIAGTPTFAAAVKNWAAFWVNHVKHLGLKPEQLVLHFVDEPSQPSQNDIIIPWVQAVRSANTGAVLWVDPIYEHFQIKPDTKLLESFEVLCPNRIYFLAADETFHEPYLKRQNQGVQLEFYSCEGPVHLLDPYAYYRLQAWTCWQYQGVGISYWAFGDRGIADGETSWNDYTGKYTYCPYFLDANSVTPGKHFEACREGVEDYEYFVMLKKAIAAAETNGTKSEVLAQAKTLLAELPKHVLKAGESRTYRWDEKLNRTAADNARVQILKMLVSLQSKKAAN